MSTLQIILIAGGGLLVLFLIVAALQPAQFRVSRHTSISAPPAVVFGHLNDFRRWTAWSPWEKIDPNLNRSYSGAPAGVGAVYEWTGNNKVGQGRMTITDSRPDEFIRIRLEFIKPFAATNTAEFTLKPEAGGTHIDWSMTGSRNFIMKAFGVFLSMDKMVGPDFERGLSRLKAVSEAA